MKKFLIIAAIALPILGVLGTCGYDKIHTMNHKGPAEATAKKYMKDLGQEYKGVSCTNKDTDNPPDGYVSCDVALKNGSTKSLSCVGAVSLFTFAPNTGCKEKVLVNMGRSK